MKPHVCPKCLGEGTVPVEDDLGLTSMGKRKCPVCKGTGVLWEPNPSLQSDLSMDYGTGIYTFGPDGERIFHHPHP